MRISQKTLESIDLIIQAGVLGLHLLFCAMGAFAPLGFVFAFLSTLFLGVYQWGFSASFHLVSNSWSGSFSLWRWIHWVASIVYVVFFSALSIYQQDDNFYIVSLIVVPDLIAYVYFGLDYWEFYKKYRFVELSQE